MTRGQKGCYIYCTHKKLSDYLKKRLNQNEGIVYPINEDENYTDLMVAEDSEEYGKTSVAMDMCFEELLERVKANK